MPFPKKIFSSIRIITVICFLVYAFQKFQLYFHFGDEYEYVKKNIWDLDETYLKTPFFDYRLPTNNMQFIFQTYKSPHEASKEILILPELQQHKKEYFTIKDLYCLKDGSDKKASEERGSCICSTKSTSNFIGPNCDIPGCVWKVDKENRKGPEFELRSYGRRVIMGLLVDHELEMTEVRFHQLSDTVDVFVILESNITSGGDPKPLYFYNALRSGYLWQFQHKIMYVFLDHIPKSYIDDGWQVYDFIRNYTSQSALKRLKNLNDDDLFLNLDSDEIPKREVILFLKYHNGFTNPVELNLRWTIYKFYWKKQQQMTNILVACTIDYLKQVCQGNAMVLRTMTLLKNNYQAYFDDFKGPKTIDSFMIGVDDDSAGFHCSWCTTPEGVSVKLRSAIHQDFPRWGDQPEKLNLDYIAGLLKTGVWFDGTKPVSYVEFSRNPEFAPKFILENEEKYIHLLKKEED